MHGILELLETSRAVVAFTVLDFKQGVAFYYLKIKVTLKDENILYVREYVSPDERLYSYHWQDKSGKLISRWDNAPHHQQLGTFPHHKHVANQRVENSVQTDLTEVLKHIEEVLTT